MTTAWSPDPLRQLWQRVTPIPPQRRDGTMPGLGWWVSPAAPGDVLLQAEETSIVLDARTGRVRWTSPVPVDPLAGARIGLVHAQQFRPGTTWQSFHLHVVRPATDHNHAVVLQPARLAESRDAVLELARAQ